MDPLLEAVAAIEQAAKGERESRDQRLNNMFLGPPGLEETVSMVRLDAAFAFWAIGRLCMAIKEDRAAQSENAPR